MAAGYTYDSMQGLGETIMCVASASKGTEDAYNAF